MSKKVSMNDIARRLGISKNTVSLGLRGMPMISEETRKQIINTAHEMGYKYKKRNSQEKCNKSSVRNICLLMSKDAKESGAFFSGIQFGIESEAKKNNYNIIIHYFDENDNNFSTPLSIEEGIVSGIITLGKISKKIINILLNYTLPLVIVDDYHDNLNLDYVLSDNHSGTYTATEYLIHSGHKEIGFCGDIRKSISFYDRYQGFLKALHFYNLPSNKSYILTDLNLQKLTNPNLSAATHTIKSLDSLPTAFICCNDVQALGLIKILNSLEIKVPQDISIVGFDDIEWSSGFSPSLTTMRVNKEHMGKMAIQNILAKLDKKSYPSSKLIISTKLIKRESVKQLL